MKEITFETQREIIFYWFPTFKPEKNGKAYLSFHFSLKRFGRKRNESICCFLFMIQEAAKSISRNVRAVTHLPHSHSLKMKTLRQTDPCNFRVCQGFGWTGSDTVPRPRFAGRPPAPCTRRPLWNAKESGYRGRVLFRPVRGSGLRIRQKIRPFCRASTGKRLHPGEGRAIGPRRTVPASKDSIVNSIQSVNLLSWGGDTLVLLE